MSALSILLLTVVVNLLFQHQLFVVRISLRLGSGSERFVLLMSSCPWILTGRSGFSSRLPRSTGVLHYVSYVIKCPSSSILILRSNRV